MTEGLGWEHVKKRRALLPLAHGKPCPLCGQPMIAFGPNKQRLQLDHVIPRAMGGLDGPVRIVHGVCNERMGAILGQKLRRREAKPHPPDDGWRSRW